MLHKIFWVVLSSFVGLALLEAPSRWWIRSRGNPLQRAKLILEPHPQWGWRQRPSLDTVFENIPVLTDADGFRTGEGGARGSPADVLVLGPSSAFGWGVRYEDTYAALTPGAFNGGQIGYSLRQGRELERFFAARGAAPRWLVLAYGVNDLDHFPFFPAPRKPRWFDASALAGLFLQAYDEAAFVAGCGFARPPGVRVPLDEFMGILHEIAAGASARGTRVAVIDTPSRYDIADDAAKASESEALYQESYRAGREGRCSNAQKILSQARRLESFRVKRDIALLNARLKDESARGEWALVPVAAQLEAAGDFVDPIHPSPEGHRKIARRLAGVLGR